jgi:predicted lipoprotein with Yx(FWY)xxD motif
MRRKSLGASIILVALLGLGGLALARSRATVISTARMQYGGKTGTAVSTTRRYALYMSTRDKKDSSRCNNACAGAYPPLTTSSSAAAKKGSGLDGKLIGVIHRKGGKLQVTYNHHPLYTSSGQAEAPGVAGAQACEGSSGGAWFVLDKHGNALKTPVVLCQGY